MGSVLPWTNSFYYLIWILIFKYNQNLINYYNFHFFFKNLMQQIKKLIEIKISKFQFQKF